MKSTLILLFLCFKYISGAINFDLHYFFCNFIFRIFNIICFSNVYQFCPISKNINKYIDCLREYESVAVN